MFSFRKHDERETRTSSEDCESLLKEASDRDDVSLPMKARRTTFSTICTTFGYIISLILSACLGAFLTRNVVVDADNFCISHTSNYSPVLSTTPITYTSHLFNGSLMHSNIFRLPASPSVDEAWQSLGVDYRALIVPSELAAASGLKPSQVKVREKYGGGYPANVEGLHHLHCLNLLRQGLWFNYGYYKEMGKGAFVNEEEVLRWHVTHCLDIIRQQLMCTVDIGVLGQVWWNKNQPTAYPDFNTKHTCRNFEAVRKWAEERQAPEIVPEDYLEPPRSIGDIYEVLP